MERISTLFLLALSFFEAHSQALVNNKGAGIYINPGAYVIVTNTAGSPTDHSGSVHNYSGYIQNGGDFKIEGDVVNDDSIAGGTTGTGLYEVLGDWINNGTVNSRQDTVKLYGANQLIGGTTPTAFYNLWLTDIIPALNSVKSQGINSSVSGWLNLSNVELATNNFNMVVNNVLTTAITNSMTGAEEDFGFVSSLDTGKLIRTTNTTAAYYYPLGTPTSTGLPFYYRALDVTPSSIAQNAYGASLVKDPSLEGYDIDAVDSLLCRVNPLYYHNVTHNTGGAPANLKVYFNAANDKPWTDIAHWENNQWNYTSTATSGFNNGYNTVEIQNWNDFDPFQFALAGKKFTVDAGPDYIITSGESVTMNPTTTATDIVSSYWTPETYLDNPNAWNVTSTPTQDMSYTIFATNELGCEAHDSMKIFVRPADLLIPTAFSPNGDGVNDVYRVVKQNVTYFVFQIFNRWGEKVFETEDVEEGWDGTFRDRPQPMDVFTWQLWYKLAGSNEKKFKSGNVTLIR